MALALLLPRLEAYPAVWFDEGYKSNAARTLAERGVYGTYTTAGFVPFDPGISSGPADMIPTALAFKLLGAGVSQARLVSVIYTLLAVGGLTGIAVVLYGIRAAPVIGLFLLAVPEISGVSLLLIGRQLLGEPAAIALIALGLLLWFRGGERPAAQRTALAGAVIGLGLLSKGQIALALIPALVLVIGARWRRQPRLLAQQLLLPVTCALVFAAWALIGGLFTPADMRAENAALLEAAIRANLLTSLLGRTVPAASWLITGIMALAVASVGLRLLARRDRSPLSNARWAEVLLAVFVGLTAVWFALLSVGWPRYAYAGLVFALLLLGKCVWDGWMWLRQRAAVPHASLLAALAVIALVVNLYPAWTYHAPDGAEQAADYIDSHVPPDAVIETWEWQLDALTNHWAFHHPNQRYLFEAIRQFSHGGGSFVLSYDLLQADPDYLIIGSFGKWTGLYNAAAVTITFTQIAEIGDYLIYQRKRS